MKGVDIIAKIKGLDNTQYLQLGEGICYEEAKRSLGVDHVYYCKYNKITAHEYWGPAEDWQSGITSEVECTCFI